jgi:hypothetical protein
MKMMFENVTENGSGVWLAPVPSHQISFVGVPKVTMGLRSILLVENPEFNDVKATVCVDMGSVTILNQGTSSEALIIDARTNQINRNIAVFSKEKEIFDLDYGPGDQEFLADARLHLVGDIKSAAEKLLHSVRSHFPGDLKEGLRHKFVNTPDNFWTVTIQTRNQELFITVRGKPSKFLPSQLNPKDDRPGYTSFKVRRLSDVQEAFNIIQASTRR